MKKRIAQALQLHDLNFETIGSLAPHVKQLSDQYVSEEGSLTPWSNAHLALAYVAYFMPLNAARLADAWREVVRSGLEFSEIWDVGSGPGTLQWMLEETAQIGPLRPIVPLRSVERASEAMRWHQLLGLSEDRWQNQWHRSIEKPKDGALGVFSYSMLELKSTEALRQFDHLLILEPSTQSRGRNLMKVRQELLGMGYHVLAPCTHSEKCPLLTQSERDWCHQRFEWNGESWWHALENELPMKNRTLTYSYLLMSRSQQPKNYFGRLIGDTLYERGKVRQMICRGEQREFLSWLTRNGEPEQIPHGALLMEAPDFAVKSNELRVLSPIQWEY